MVDGDLNSEPAPESEPETELQLGRRSSSKCALTLGGEFQNCVPTQNTKNLDHYFNTIWLTEDNQAQAQAQGTTSSKTVDEQPTLAKMTLEDFLVRAGLVEEPDCPQAPPPPQLPPRHPPPPQPPWNLPPQQQPPCPVGPNYGVGVNNGGGYGGAGAPIEVDSEDQYGLNIGGRKRKPKRSLEKDQEIRQRRMMKNRESAARSRLMKQKLTTGLQIEQKKLKEENEHLKQTVAELEGKLNQQEEEARANAPESPKAAATRRGIHSPS